MDKIRRHNVVVQTIR